MIRFQYGNLNIPHLTGSALFSSKGPAAIAACYPHSKTVASVSAFSRSIEKRNDNCAGDG